VNVQAEELSLAKKELKSLEHRLATKVDREISDILRSQTAAEEQLAAKMASYESLIEQLAARMES
jgi:hypothetical protein